MAYGGIMFYNLHMPLYILGTFTEYPYFIHPAGQGTFVSEERILCLHVGESSKDYLCTKVHHFVAPRK